MNVHRSNGLNCRKVPLTGNGHDCAIRSVNIRVLYIYIYIYIVISVIPLPSTCSARLGILKYLYSIVCPMFVFTYIYMVGTLVYTHVIMPL